MEKSQYLSKCGYSENFTVLNAGQMENVLSIPGATGSCFKIIDPQGIQAFGHGAYVVKKSFLAENNVQYEIASDASPLPVQSPPAVPPIPEAPVNAPEPVPIPAAKVDTPPIVPFETSDEIVESLNKVTTLEPVIEPQQTEPIPATDIFEGYSEICKIRIANLVAKGYENNPQERLITMKGTVYSYRQVEELPNHIYTSFITVEAPAEPQKETPVVTETKEVFLCGNAEQGQTECGEQCEYCKKAETAGFISVNAFRLDEQRVAKEQQEKDLIEKKYVSRLKDFTELGFKEEGEFIVNGAFKLPLANVKEMTDEQHTDAINFYIVKDVVEKPVAEKAADELIKDAKAGEKPASVVVNQNKFFSRLTAFGFQQLNLTINNLGNGKLNVIVKPENFSGDSAYDDISPLSLTASVEDFDNEFFEAISTPLEKTNSLMSNAKLFLSDLAEKEKKTKAADEQNKKVKALVEKATKFHDDKEFKEDDKKSVEKALKMWDDILVLNATEKTALAGKKKASEQLSKIQPSLM